VNVFLAIFLLVLFWGIDLPSWTQLKNNKQNYFSYLRSFLNKKSPQLYSFVFVALCFLGFSLWESLIYFLIKKNAFEIPRAVVGTGLFLWAIVLKSKSSQKSQFNENLIFLGWVLLLGSWFSGILFGPWLYYRRNTYLKELGKKG